MDNGSGCLTEGDVVRFLQGSGDRSMRARVEQHLGGCADCLLMVAGATGASAAAAAEWTSTLRPPLLAPGTLVAGRYRVGRLIGVGGMGEVHEAQDLLLERAIALKTLNGALFGMPRALAQLKAE